MRFDDMIATVLRQPLDTPAARAVAWRQVVDLVAQRRDGGEAARVYDMLRELRRDVPTADRTQAAEALVGRDVPIGLARLFADEPPAIAAIVLGGVRLAPAAWIELLPMLTPTARGFVRHRRDLPGEVRGALDSFGASDLVLRAPEASAAPEEAAPTGVPGPIAISDVMARIEAYRSRPARAAPPVAEPASPIAAPVIGRFRFETDPAGTVTWTDAAPRGAVIGLSIARAGDQDGGGIDAHAAGAFRSRAPFRGARLVLAGEGTLAGDWRISGVPAFADDSGRFTGYRGAARRPLADERAEPSEVALPFGLGFQPDSLRQLVHELRTPINAIVGFAELIERQVLGPAASDYRVRASTIAREGHRLLDAVEDLDSAARIGARRWSVDHGAVDGVALLTRLHAELAPLAAARGVALTMRAEPVPPIDADAVAVERMMTRLVQAVLGLARAGESLDVVLERGDGRATLNIARPAVLAGRDERALLDPGYAPDGDWPDAPVLGLGFALRLVRNLAAAARGGLIITAERFRLHLPTRGDSAGAESGRG